MNTQFADAKGILQTYKNDFTGPSHVSGGHVVTSELVVLSYVHYPPNHSGDEIIRDLILKSKGYRQSDNGSTHCGRLMSKVGLIRCTA